MHSGEKRKRDSKLIAVIIGSLLLHIIGGLILAGVKVVEYALVDDAQFEAPAEVSEEEPPPELKVRIAPIVPKLQLPALSLKPVSNITVKNIDVDLPTMSESFTVSAGLGSTGGGGLRLGGGLGLDFARFPDITGFGTTQKVEYAWEGTVYLFEPGEINQLLDNRKEKVTALRDGRRQSNKIYNYSLNLPGQDFSEGFPGVTDQYEWFAINFETKIFWPASLSGEYEFRITSDDGSVLLINRDLVVDNDGNHGMSPQSGTYELKQGLHSFQLAYYQGPATQLGLILEYRKAGSSEWEIFDLKDFIRYQKD